MNGLDEDQVAHLVGRLKKQKKLLTSTIGAHGESDANYLAVAGEVHDSGDESVADLLGDIRISSQYRAIDALTEVDEALQRITDGSYGRCIDCGGEIGFSRLVAHSVAKRCINCKEKYENLKLHSSGPSL